MFLNDLHLNMINSPVRSFQGKVECYDSTDALVATYTHLDDLKSFQVERVGEGKFFGYGYVQKVNIKLLDAKREKSFTTSNKFKLSIGVQDNYVSTFPMFKITETNRDEKTNTLSITAYDALKGAAEHKFDDVTIEVEGNRFTLETVAIACATHMGLPAVRFIVPEGHTLAQTIYTEELLNLSGEETLRNVFDWIAEVTGSIYYLDATGTLIFRVLDKDGEAGYVISKERYAELKSKDNRRLGRITKATTLGDNIHVELAVSGTNQIIMNNPFFELRLDTHEMLDKLAPHLLGLTVNQFECDWRGNYLLEIGDKIALECKDGSYAYSYLLEDKFLFNGGVEQETEWKWDTTQNEDEHSTPSTIGEAINQTIAKVDKVNKEITLMIEDVEEMERKVTSIQMTSENIQATVEAQSSELGALSKRVEATMSADDIRLEIQESLKDVNEVTTTTGYTFNKDGLMVTKDGSEMKTQVSEDGMTVYRKNEVVLRADNEGVKAEDLHATTYLLIGTNSRLENYRGVRTGCFWIGEERT